MFVWGPGNLFTYHELEELLQATTGWRITFWELMKTGERRVMLMRYINHLRGYGPKDDKLPARVFDPLPSGPTKGRSMESQQFQKALSTYYGMLGCDAQSGIPLPGRLMELGLEWVLDLKSCDAHTQK
jgi:aldehyde:ferredoxin oxidoreductase